MLPLSNDTVHRRIYKLSISNWINIRGGACSAASLVQHQFGLSTVNLIARNALISKVTMQKQRLVNILCLLRLLKISIPKLIVVCVTRSQALTLKKFYTILQPF